MSRAAEIATLVAAIERAGGSLANDARYWDLRRTCGDASVEVLRHLRACVAHRRREVRVLLATDEGTHGGPATQRVYREPDGTLTLARRHGEGQLPETTLPPGTKLADLPTDGRWRSIRGVQS